MTSKKFRNPEHTVKKQALLSRDELLKDFVFEYSTGKLFKMKKGVLKEWGYLNKGYVCIHYKDTIYFAHRVIWFMHYGVWPKKQLDHINGNRSDNRIENLREVSNQTNQLNGKKHRQGHLQGTTYIKREDKWAAQIGTGKKRIWIGRFRTQKEAHDAYLEKLKEINPAAYQALGSAE